MKINRGDVWLVDMNGCVGSEQSGTRPCVIIQNNLGNIHSPTTIVCPATTRTKSFTATHLEVTELSSPSSIMFEQIRVVDKSRLIKYLCTLSDENIEKMSAKLQLVLGM